MDLRREVASLDSSGSKKKEELASRVCNFKKLERR